MKKILLVGLVLFGFLTIKAQTNSTPAQVDIAKVLKFTNDNYDMGKIAFGKPTEFTVSIQNISNYNISLDNVMVGCGCTTPKYTKDQVILPGTTATVVLGFNGSAVGMFSKSATLFFSGNLNKTVSFHGEGVQ
ncbi:MAG: DUF1573 domain-containing protein [Chitinophagia bacterium]|jgi:hypothetical protein|nr:DUF1573 domain-containing protein [Chitinophagia bacterium]